MQNLKEILAEILHTAKIMLVISLVIIMGMWALN